MKPGDVVDVKEASAILNISKSTVYRAIAGGFPGRPPLPAYKIGRKHLMRRADLANWLTGKHPNQLIH